jgi:hypothetical protein
MIYLNRGRVFYMAKHYPISYYNGLAEANEVYRKDPTPENKAKFHEKVSYFDHEDQMRFDINDPAAVDTELTKMWEEALAASNDPDDHVYERWQSSLDDSDDPGDVWYTSLDDSDDPDGNGDV